MSAAGCGAGGLCVEFGELNQADYSRRAG